MTLERLWAGWRSEYLTGDDREPAGAGTLFERIWNSELPDAERYVVWQGPTCFAVLNAYPYSTGHLLVLPQRPVADLADLEATEATELWAAVRDAVSAIRAAYRPDGINVGLNLGRAAGAGVPDHLHVHCVPRWLGDTNFTTAVAETRVLPEALSESWRKLRESWPSSLPSPE